MRKAVLAPYLNEGIALTGRDKWARQPYHTLVEVKRGTDFVNKYLEQAPLIHTSSWLTGQTPPPQLLMLTKTFELAVTMYDEEVRQPAMGASAK